MALILAIEDDPVLRILYARALTGLDGVAAVLAGTVTEAKSMLQHTSPDLVLLDLRLPDGTGFDLLPDLSNCQPKPAVVVVSAFLEELSDDPRLGRFGVISKPVDLDELRNRVQEMLQLGSSTHPFSMPEYLQMACLGRHSLLLQTTVAGETGMIAVYNGEVWAASCGRQRAFAAFYLLAGVEQCAIEVRPWPGGEPPERQLVGSYQELLLEAARRQDEEVNDRGAHLDGDELDFSDLLGSYPPQVVVDPSSTGDEGCMFTAAELVSEGVRAVIARDYPTAVRLLERALSLEPTNISIKHRLERLYELGHHSSSVERAKTGYWSR